MSTRTARARAVFLDRDGTLTEEHDWVRKPSDLVLYAGAADAVALLSAAGYLTVLVTNQSAVARGMITESELDAIHAHLQREVARAGGRLDAVYYCPHHPSEGSGQYRRECHCRKPRSGLIERAVRELAIDPATSWIVGDAERDLAAGAALGVRGILVGTGKGSAESARLAELGREPQLRFADVLAAARWIVAQDR